MPIWRRNDDRTGLRFWMSLAVGLAVLGNGVFLVAGAFEGPGPISSRYPLSVGQIVMAWSLLALSTGLIAGLLNPYVNSLVASIIVATVSLYPCGVLIGFFMEHGRRGILDTLIGAAVISALMGAIYGAVLYEPSSRSEQ